MSPRDVITFVGVPLLLGLVTLLGGCAQIGRYEIEVVENAVWRLDTVTGALEACGWEQGRPICTPFPVAKK